MTCSSSSNEVLEKKEKIMYVAYDDKDRVCNALDTDIEKIINTIVQFVEKRLFLKKV